MTLTNTARNKLLVHLDLSEIINLNSPAAIPVRGESVGIRKGSAYANNSARPHNILDLVREKFRPLQNMIDIQLGKGNGAHRCIKARYVHGIDQTYDGTLRHCSRSNDR